MRQGAFGAWGTAFVLSTLVATSSCQGGIEDGSGGVAGGGVGGAGPYPDSAFVTVWKTESGGDGWEGIKPMTDDRVIRLPLVATGHYDFVVDWGDGSTGEVTTSGDPDRGHTYATAGEYVVTIHGLIEGWHFPASCVWEDYSEDCLSNDTTDAPKLLEIKQWGTFRFGATPGAFQSCANLRVTASDVPDLSPPVTLAGAFKGCEKLARIPSIGAWDVSQVTDLSDLFYAATTFNGDLSAWDTSSVTNMSDLFYQAESFNGDVSNWDTSRVTDMTRVFSFAHGFSGDVSSWDTSSVTSMSGLFEFAKAFNGDVSSWDTANVTDMSRLFAYASAFSGDVSSWNTSNVTNLSEAFSGTSVTSGKSFRSDISTWDTSKVKNMSFALANSDFNGDISSWDTSSVTNMQGMFLGSTFNGDISGWDTSSVTDMSDLFSGAAFNRDISAWDTSNVTTMRRMFYETDGPFDAIEAFDQNLATWNVGALITAEDMLTRSGMSASNYDALLIGWAAQPTQDDVPLGVGELQPTEAAASAYAVLTEERGWIITTGSPPPF